VYYDALTTAAVADQLRPLAGGRIQEVVQVDAWTIGLEIYVPARLDAKGERIPGRRCYLVASAHPQRSRAHLTASRLRRGVDAPTPLLLLLRKYARDGRVTSVQAIEFERILELHIEPPSNVREGQPEVRLVIEAMGRHANVILLSSAPDPRWTSGLGHVSQ